MVRNIKVEILEDFAWYKKGQIIKTIDSKQFRFLEKLGLVKEIKEEKR